MYTTVYIGQLKSHASTLSEFMGTVTFDQNGNPFPLKHLAKGLCIGFDNTDLLFVDVAGSNTNS